MRRQWSFERDMITDHRRALWGSTVTLFFLVHLIGKHTCLRDASPGLRVGTHVGATLAQATAAPRQQHLEHEPEERQGAPMPQPRGRASFGGGVRAGRGAAERR